MNIAEVKIRQTGPLAPNGCTLVAFLAERRVGHAHICINKNKATLADIITANYQRQWFSHFPFFKTVVSYRKKGIGSKLLRHVISLCEENEIKEIHGEIVGDLSYLAAWYKKFGFKVIDGNKLILKFY